MRIWFVLIVVVLLITNLILIRLLLDSSISADHAQTELKYKEAQIDLLRELAIDIRDVRTQAAIEALIRRKYRNHVVKSDTPSSIEIDEIELRFQSGELIEIRTIND
jgi:type II secretory pathway component PulM